MGEILFDADNFVIVRDLNEELLYAVDRSKYRSAFLETCNRLADRSTFQSDAIEYPKVTVRLLVEKDSRKYDLSLIYREVTYDMIENVWMYN